MFWLLIRWHWKLWWSSIVLWEKEILHFERSLWIIPDREGLLSIYPISKMIPVPAVHLESSLCIEAKELKSCRKLPIFIMVSQEFLSQSHINKRLGYMVSSKSEAFQLMQVWVFSKNNVFISKSTHLHFFPSFCSYFYSLFPHSNFKAHKSPPHFFSPWTNVGGVE